MSETELTDSENDVIVDEQRMLKSMRSARAEIGLAEETMTFYKEDV
jgi:hypothetical protein